MLSRSIATACFIVCSFGCLFLQPGSGKAAATAAAQGQGNKAVEVTKTPAQEQPKPGENYGVTVMQREPAFTEEELQRALRDMQGSTRWVADKVVNVLMEKGWARNRAFYMVMRIRIGLNAIASAQSRAAFAKEMPHALPSPQEEKLIKKYKKEIKALQFREEA